MRLRRLVAYKNHKSRCHVFLVITPDSFGACQVPEVQFQVLHMKRLNQTESPLFVIFFCVLYFQRQSFWTFILSFVP